MLITGSLALAAAVASVVASPLPDAPSFPAQSIPLHRRAVAKRSDDELAAWMQRQRAHVLNRYRSDSTTTRKRADAVLSDYGADSTYFGAISVGSAQQSFYVLLDTGSSDLWIESSSSGASTMTTSTGETVQLINPNSSSTVKALNRPFQIQYGSGAAAGYLYQDSVSFANITVANQVYAAVSRITQNLLGGPISGIMGMAWQSIASSGASPWWQSAGISQFAFALTRYNNDTSATEIEPGGYLDINTLDSSRYTGSINYASLTSQTYWLTTLDGVAVNGQNVVGSNSRVAIDSGTTLIAGPTSAVQAIYGAISGSQALTGNNEGYFVYPCSANPTISFTFAGQSYSVGPGDFNIGQVSSGLGSNGGTNPFGGTSPGSGRSGSSSSSTQMCIGAIFDAGTGSSTTAPAWIVGDAFMKNCYVVFRSSPAAVGFANLAGSVESSTGEASLSAAGSTNISSTTVSGSNGSSARASAAAISARPFLALLAIVPAALLYTLA